MGWLGMLIGSYVGGSAMGGGGPLFRLLGVIAGAMLGSKVEESVRGAKRPQGARRPQGGGFTSSSQDRSMVFCASVAAMLAKMAKADGVVSRYEIDGVEEAFRRLGFTPAARRYAIEVFRKAKDDPHSIYDYARDFAEAVDSIDVRELFYEILWDVACADGVVSQSELQILRQIPAALRIRSEWFAYFASRRVGRQGGGRAGGRSAAQVPLAEAYSILGASASDSPDELKRKYRELAKKNHPDALRAQGLPEEMIGKATERMSRINEAWSKIKEARGL